MNRLNITYMKCGERYEDIIDHRRYTHNLSSCEIKAEKNSGLNGIRAHDLCDTALQCSPELSSRYQCFGWNMLQASVLSTINTACLALTVRFRWN